MRDIKEVDDFGFQIYRTIVTSCKKCKGVDSTCDCRTRYAVALAAYEACIPRDFHDFGIKDVDTNKDVFKTIRKYVKKMNIVVRKGYGLFLVGDNGVGKSAFISHVLMEAIRKGRTAYYTTAPQLEYNLKRGWRSSEVEERLEWMLTSDILAIDELGKEYDSSTKGFSISQVERILKGRYDSNRPVLLASNRSVREVAELYGSTIASVLSGKYKILNMQPGDQRKKTAAKMKKEMGY